MDGYEILDPRFRRCILSNAPLVKLGEGFAWLEGPVWFADQNCLLFSDIPGNRILRWTEDGGISVFRSPSGFANGHTRDRQGRLVGCSHQHRCVTRTEFDGSITVLASHYQGRQLNAPNDVVCRSDGSLWFSDPLYGISTDYEGGKQASALPPTLYRLDPDGTLSIAADDFAGPNGLAFSPDERLLYVSDTGHQFDDDAPRHIRVFDVSDDGTLSHGRIFHQVNPGLADGFRIDQDGNIWTSAGDGVHCIASDGTKLGEIHVPYTVSNLTFGGRNRSRLFICAAHTLYAIYTNQRGAAWP